MLFKAAVCCHGVFALVGHPGDTVSSMQKKRKQGHSGINLCVTLMLPFYPILTMFL